MISQAFADLWFGFGVALAPQNLMWSFVGVLVGNLVGVLPGMGPLSAIAMLLPLTYAMQPIGAILMLAGIFYGSQYGGAIGAILLNLPSHPPHAVTCLDGYPMTRAGKGGTALGITMLSGFFAASFGIVVMIFASGFLVKVSTSLGPPELFSVMLLGLVAGATMALDSPLKGIAMTLLGMLLGMVGTDVDTGTARFTFGQPELSDQLDLIALAMGLFGVADFLTNVNLIRHIGTQALVRFRNLWPTRAELRQAFFPMVRGTLIGTLFGALPGTGPTITTFVAYAFERRISSTPERFGRGALEGVASPEASSHSKTQVDFIPTLSLGIPGDAVMALLLGALIVHGIQPGPQLIAQHPDLFWGLVASFWIGNVILMVLNIPLIGVWVTLLQLPYRYLFPSALLFISIGVFSTNNRLFEVGEVLFFGVAGAILLALEFPVATILLGFVLGPMMEENFRRTLLLSHGDLAVFMQRPASALILCSSAFLLLVQLYLGLRRSPFRAGSAEEQRGPLAPGK